MKMTSLLVIDLCYRIDSLDHANVTVADMNLRSQWRYPYGDDELKTPALYLEDLFEESLYYVLNL